MLHVVPALILLILQGPSAADRPACHGGLPAVLEALNAQEQGARKAVKASNREAAIASLLALGAKDPRWSAAIERLFEGGGLDAVLPRRSDASESAANPCLCPHIPRASVPVARHVFATSSRFRDGPSSR